MKTCNRPFSLRRPPFLRRCASAAAAIALIGGPAFAQSMPAQSMPGQSMPGQSMPGQSMPGQMPAGQAAAGQTASVPFPSAIPGAAKVALPLSDKPMVVDEHHVDGQIGRAETMSDARLKTMQMGKDGLSAADPSGYRDDLRDMAATQRQIRLLKLKQEEADAAAKLYSTVYDGKREEEAAARAADGAASSGGDRAAAQKADAAQADRLAAAQKMAAIEEENRKHQAEVDAAAKRAKDVPLPKVVSVVGSGDSVTAVVLVPYQGQMTVMAGQSLPGGLRVTRVSAAGVVVTDEHGKTFALGFGTSVPAAPPAVEAVPAASVPAASVPSVPVGIPGPFGATSVFRPPVASLPPTSVTPVGGSFGFSPGTPGAAR